MIILHFHLQLGMGPQYFTSASVFDLQQVAYESRVPVKHHRKLDVRHLEYIKTSPIEQLGVFENVRVINDLYTFEEHLMHH